MTHYRLHRELGAIGNYGRHDTATQIQLFTDRYQPLANQFGLGGLFGVLGGGATAYRFGEQAIDRANGDNFKFDNFGNAGRSAYYAGTILNADIMPALSIFGLGGNNYAQQPILGTGFDDPRVSGGYAGGIGGLFGGLFGGAAAFTGSVFGGIGNFFGNLFGGGGSRSEEVVSTTPARASAAAAPEAETTRTAGSFSDLEQGVMDTLVAEFNADRASGALAGDALAKAERNMETVSRLLADGAINVQVGDMPLGNNATEAERLAFAELEEALGIDVSIDEIAAPGGATDYKVNKTDLEIS